MSKVKAEYIWLDGYVPTANLRSKTKIVDGPVNGLSDLCLLYTSPSPRDKRQSRMPSSA